jgi:hypothetical protein
MTATFNVTEARDNFAEMISQSAIEEVFIKKHNETVGVLISLSVWEKLCDVYEDWSDYLSAVEVITDPTENAAMADLKRELGL